jgi:hypothetical protein
MHLLYDGRSLLDGSPIVVLATGDKRPSANRKTGPMIQTWILCKDVSPTFAQNTDMDVAICGNCPHRKTSCYVNTGQAPQTIWNAYNLRRWRTPLKVLTSAETVALGTERPVRIGAYGDPAAAPFEIWDSLVSNSVLHTGYTHQWETCDQRLQQLCMASVDTLTQKLSAKAMGWRTFHVLSHLAPRSRDEVLCPASEEAGSKLQCVECGACNGNITGRNGNIAINVHGPNWKKENFTATAARLCAQEARVGLKATGTG